MCEYLLSMHVLLVIYMLFFHRLSTIIINAWIIDNPASWILAASDLMALGEFHQRTLN
jgi:hypothetical protein